MPKVLITTAMYDSEKPSAIACSVSTLIVDCRTIGEANEIVKTCNDMTASDMYRHERLFRTAIIISGQAMSEVPRLSNTPEVLHAAECYALSFDNNGPSGAMTSLERLIKVIIEKA